MTDTLTKIELALSEKRLGSDRELKLEALLHAAADEIKRLKGPSAQWDYFESRIKRLLSLDEKIYDRLGLKVGDSIIDGVADYLEATMPKEAAT